MPIMICFAVIVVLVMWRNRAPKQEIPTETESIEPVQTEIVETEQSLEAFAAENGYAMEEWPEKLVELYEFNEDAREYVRNYPKYKDKTFEIDLTGMEQSKQVPLLFQWDKRWGYTIYGDDVLALTGCGPTCLSMLCIYLLHDAKYTPRYVADFSEREGYYVPGFGSSWTLMSEGAEKLGLSMEELPLGKQVILDHLEAGEPVVCSMRPGIFTRVGHFILMVGTEDGKIMVNDPNSIIRSGQLWDYDEIKDQISNLWACSAA